MQYPFRVVTWQRMNTAWAEKKTLKARTTLEATRFAIKAAKRIGNTGTFAAAVIHHTDEHGNQTQLPGVQVGRPNGSVFTITPQEGDWQKWLAENMGLN